MRRAVWQPNNAGGVLAHVRAYLVVGQYKNQGVKLWIINLITECLSIIYLKS